MWLQPAFDYHSKAEMKLKIAGDDKSEKFDQVDQFGGEVEYFSQCILDNKQPEPDGYEGLADIRIVQALIESTRTRQPVKLPPYEKATRPTKDQQMEKKFAKPEKHLVNAKSASGQ
jgi:glucose-fructose oxidoreductase